MRATELAATVLLAANAIRDLRTREIFLRLTLLAGAAGAALRIAEPLLSDGAPMLFGQASPLIALAALSASCIPGAGLLLLTWLSRGGIGAGDGVLLIAVGIWTGVLHASLVLFLALFLASGCGVVCLAAGRSRKQEFPFVPFLLAAHVCVAVLG